MESKTSDRDAREEKVPKLRASLPCRVESSIIARSASYVRGWAQIELSVVRPENN